MLIPAIILTAVFYFLVLIQNSFLVHFSVFGAFANLVLVCVCLVSFLEEKKSYYGLIPTIAGGIFIDLRFGAIGLSSLLLLIVYLFVKEMPRQLRDVSYEYNIFYYLILLFISSIFFGIISRFSLNIFPLIAGLAFNLIFGVFFFYLFKLFYGNRKV